MFCDLFEIQGDSRVVSFYCGDDIGCKKYPLDLNCLLTNNPIYLELKNLVVSM